LAGGALEVLEPLSSGHPMLGRTHDGQLRALPADLPCSSDFWASAGGVSAVWRRGLWQPDASSIALRSATSARPGAVAVAPPRRRALCVRVPAAALALARSQRPEWLGSPLQSAPSTGGVLVFPGSEPAQTDHPQATDVQPAQLVALAKQLVDVLGSGADIKRADAEEVVITAHRSLHLSRAAALLRRLSGRVRLPVSIAVADSPETAFALANSLGAGQLLFVPRVAAHHSLVGQVAAPTPAPAAPVAGVAGGTSLVASVRTEPPEGAPEAVQLSLFDRLEAA